MPDGDIEIRVHGTAIALGAEPLAVYRAASVSAARAFRLADRGLVAPGWRADLAIISSLEACDVEMVLSAGRIVDDALFAARTLVEPVARHSVKARPVTAADFTHRSNDGHTHVIGIEPGKIITHHLHEDMSENLVLPLKVKIKRSVSNPAGIADILDAGSVKSLPRKYLLCSPDNHRPPVALAHIGAGLIIYYRNSILHHSPSFAMLSSSIFINSSIYNKYVL